MGKTVFRGSFCGEAATRSFQNPSAAAQGPSYRRAGETGPTRRDRPAAGAAWSPGEGQQQEPAVCSQNSLRVADQVGQRADCCPDQGGEQCTDQIFYRPGRKGKPCVNGIGQQKEGRAVNCQKEEFSSSVLFTWPFSVSRKASQKDSTRLACSFSRSARRSSFSKSWFMLSPIWMVREGPDGGGPPPGKHTAAWNYFILGFLDRQ